MVRKKHNRFPSSELAGSPYDGVALPSAQVQPPKVPEGKPAAKKSLAKIPPGTPTPDAYVSTIEQSTKSALPTYPSTSYPSTPYSNTRTQNAGRNEVPGSAAPNVAKPRYPATGFAAGSPQPTYPTTSVGSAPDESPPANSRPLAQDGRGPSSGTYGFNAPTTGNTGPNPKAAGTGPRYSSNVGAFAAGTPSAGPSVVPPANTQFPTASTSPSIQSPRTPVRNFARPAWRFAVRCPPCLTVGRYDVPRVTLRSFLSHHQSWSESRCAQPKCGKQSGRTLPSTCRAEKPGCGEHRTGWFHAWKYESQS